MKKLSQLVLIPLAMIILSCGGGCGSSGPQAGGAFFTSLFASPVTSPPCYSPSGRESQEVAVEA